MEEGGWDVVVGKVMLDVVHGALAEPAQGISELSGRLGPTRHQRSPKTAGNI